MTLQTLLSDSPSPHATSPSAAISDDSFVLDHPAAQTARAVRGQRLVSARCSRFRQLTPLSSATRLDAATQYARASARTAHGVRSGCLWRYRRCYARSRTIVLRHAFRCSRNASRPMAAAPKRRSGADDKHLRFRSSARVQRLTDDTPRLSLSTRVQCRATRSGALLYGEYIDHAHRRHIAHRRCRSPRQRGRCGCAPENKQPPKPRRLFAGHTFTWGELDAEPCVK